VWPSPSPAEIKIGTRIKRHLRNRLLAGLLVLVPLGITLIALRLIFGAMAVFIRPFLEIAAGESLPPWALETIAIGLFIVLIYLVGLVTKYMLGRRLVAFGEAFILRIPLVKSIYSASKQVVDTFSSARGVTFREVVWVTFPCQGTKSIGFVTNVLRDKEGAERLVVFVPTVPNPTTGFMLILPAAEIERTQIPVDEAFRMIVSGGVLLPERL
jgi:uncharacterized membrane protein